MYYVNTGQVDFWLLPRKISVISDEIASLFILVLPDRNAYKEFQHQEIRIEFKVTMFGDKIKFTRRIGEFANEEFVAKRAKESAP